ncbi:unnamed protein product [Penicillium salamii]|uniref:Cytochrome P450 n=1 Tax=Penicillium salamii TaxID=1612424 RepID=A0A9W4JJD3_9EURO|nr:unnamed protein product [Penicillium salamii]CAG8266523.1 unnamed protein product [Penicillium salamii]CAG8362835.1 unnamed protein product [Penicillium salamii]CAG8364212.1 unnamed protein product [Penicillium salamii]CAG8390656.1 unnamed protein product [Penicillium salamii]
MSYSPDIFCILGIISGVSLHTLLYRYGDWDTKSPTLVLAYLLAMLTGTIGLQYSSSVQNLWRGSLADIWRLFAYHLMGVYMSMLIYRAFFHRLVRFPGPILACLSNFYITRLAAKKLLLHEEIHDLHAQFGDYVRLGKTFLFEYPSAQLILHASLPIGPRELSITDPAAVTAIYGTRSETTKGPWYTLLDPRTPMSFTRDKIEHAARRKIWDQSFNTKSLDAYEPLVTKCAQQLIDVIDQRLDKSIEMSTWVRYYAFEVMANLAFGKPFSMLTEQTESYFLKVMREDMKLVGYLRHLPWLSTLLMRTPVVNQNNKRFWRWIEGQFSERIEVKDPSIPISLDLYLMRICRVQDRNMIPSSCMEMVI